MTYNSNCFCFLIANIYTITIAPKNIPPINAFLNAILGPARIANTPPVIKPEAILLYPSSVLRSFINKH
jgi:hypothetical protein